MGTDKLQLKRLAYSLHFIVQFAPFVRSETLSFVTTAVIEIMGARRHGQEGALALPWKMYTVSQKKVYPWMFGNNFGKCGPIFKILSPGDS